MDWKVENVNVSMFECLNTSMNNQGCQTGIPTQYQHHEFEKDWKMPKLKWVNNKWNLSVSFQFIMFDILSKN